jgi:hypothetical protein
VREERGPSVPKPFFERLNMRILPIYMDRTLVVLNDEREEQELKGRTDDAEVEGNRIRLPRRRYCFVGVQVHRLAHLLGAHAVRRHESQKDEDVNEQANPGLLMLGS